jgi:hypothetical protein
LNALEPEEMHRTEEYLRQNAEARRKLEILRAALAPLAADREPIEPPTGLFERTMAKLAGVMPHRVKPAMPTPAGEPFFSPSRWRRVDALVACSILVLVGGLGTSGLVRVKESRDRAQCQNNLRQLHGALNGYTLVRNGAFPAISDQPPNNTAASFVPMLIESGQLTNAPDCPRAPASERQRSYAYALGYRDDSGRLHGLRVETCADYSDTMPILADRAQPMSHSRGFNVLYVGGGVRFCTSPNVGVGGDDIFHNLDGRIAAGKHKLDSALGYGDIAP